MRILFPLRKLVDATLKTVSPRLHATAKIWFGGHLKGRYFNNKFSPHLEFINVSYEEYFDSLQLAENSIFLAIGAGGAERREQLKFIDNRAQYYILDTEEKESTDQIVFMRADACEHIPLPDRSVDFVYSNSVFEHLYDPFQASKEISRVLKSGGVVYTCTLFSWRYHPVSQDYWRFTHTGLKQLFEPLGITTLTCGYDISSRRASTLGGKILDSLDSVKADGYGGWLENWMVLHVGKKV